MSDKSPPPGRPMILTVPEDDMNSAITASGSVPREVIEARMNGAKDNNPSPAPTAVTESPVSSGSGPAPSSGQAAAKGRLFGNIPTPTQLLPLGAHPLKPAAERGPSSALPPPLPPPSHAPQPGPPPSRRESLPAVLAPVSARPHGPSSAPLSGQPPPSRQPQPFATQQPSTFPIHPQSKPPGQSFTQPAAQWIPVPSIVGQPPPATSVRTDVARASGPRPSAARVVRSRAYSFVLDVEGKPIEIGSGRSAKAYLGEERWLESKTDFRRDIVIKILQKGVSEEDAMRFQMEKELVERVQGHPNIVHLFASGEGDDPQFIPESIRDKVECEFMILERLEMSLEERLKGSRQKGKRDDLLAVSGLERIFRVLDYMIPVASAIEFAHLVRNVCHRDLKPANVLVRLPNPKLRGSTLEVRLADFNVAKVQDEEVNFQMTRAHMQVVPGTLFFQSPEQETNVLELLVNVTQGSPEVEFFEDFYIQIEKNDTFVLFNHSETYPILYADRARKKVMLGQPYAGPSESSVRAKVQKSVGRPADIYSIGALFYYLISGAYANPKTLYDNFHKFIEYERVDELNTIQDYLDHEYSVINSLRTPKSAEQGPDVAPADRFFSYKPYLDGNGDLIDANVMSIIAKCMIRNKSDSYCQAHDIETQGISDVVRDMINLYSVFGVHPSAQPATLGRLAKSRTSHGLVVRSFRNIWWSIRSWFRRPR